ncbi:hypothetical protein ACWDRR_36915 [Kitasatospora sp. NPDC003701]
MLYLPGTPDTAVIDTRAQRAARAVALVLAGAVLTAVALLFLPGQQ